MNRLWSSTLLMIEDGDDDDGDVTDVYVFHLFFKVLYNSVE